MRTGAFAPSGSKTTAAFRTAVSRCCSIRARLRGRRVTSRSRSSGASPSNGWGGSWRNGIFPFHHYHSTSHEVLGIARGSARVRFGGEKGQTVEVAAGDVVVIPAGVGHKNEGSSPDLLVIGAYPEGRDYDLCRGEPGRAAARAREHRGRAAAGERSRPRLRWSPPRAMGQSDALSRSEAREARVPRRRDQLSG